MKLYLTPWFKNSIIKPCYEGVYQVKSKNINGKDNKNDIFYAKWDGKFWRGTTEKPTNPQAEFVFNGFILSMQNRTWRGIEVVI